MESYYVYILLSPPWFSLHCHVLCCLPCFWLLMTGSWSGQAALLAGDTQGWKILVCCKQWGIWHCAFIVQPQSLLQLYASKRTVGLGQGGRMRELNIGGEKPYALISHLMGSNKYSSFSITEPLLAIAREQVTFSSFNYSLDSLGPSSTCLCKIQS